MASYTGTSNHRKTIHLYKYLLTLYPKYTQELYIISGCTETPTKYLLTLNTECTQERYIIIRCTIIPSKYSHAVPPKCTLERYIMSGCTDIQSELQPHYTQGRYITKSRLSIY